MAICSTNSSHRFPTGGTIPTAVRWKIACGFLSKFSRRCAVRNAFPREKPVGVRISASDWVEGGWDVEQSVVFARELEKRGSAYIHVSSGGLSPQQKIALGPGYQVPFSKRIKAEIKMPVIAVGLITEAKEAEQILLAGEADLIALARAMLYDPRWPWHAAAELGAQVNAPPQYLRSQPHDLKNLFYPVS
jgi:2,4-dienoyl-CoA reductase-like NADH-dependent reductase (Old Yellow Enzyme family)